MNKDFTHLSLSFALIIFLMVGVPILYGAFQKDGEVYCKTAIHIPCIKKYFMDVNK